MTWLEILREFGLATAVILFLLGFGARYLWPFLTGQVDKERTARLVEHQAFLASLKEMQAERASERGQYIASMNEIRQLREKERADFLAMLKQRDDAFTVELRKMAEAIDKLRLEIRRWRGKPSGESEP